MARRILGRYYLVEPGVVACRRGFVRSTGYAGQYCAHLTIVRGTEHLFTEAVLGPTFTAADGREYPTARLRLELAEVAKLPGAIRERYRLTGCDLLSIVIVDASYFRAFPTEAW